MYFDEPDEVSGERINPKDVLGHLLLVWAVDYIEHSPTKYTQPGKQSDVIVVDCVDLDATDDPSQPYGRLVRKCWWRNGRLIGALRGKIGTGKPMLALMAQGVATMGQPPYELISATKDPESVVRANTWLGANPDFTPSQPGSMRSTQMDSGIGATIGSSQPTQPVQQTGQRGETMLERMARISQGNGLPPKPPSNADQSRTVAGSDIADSEIPF
jgi:hypothetical protein